MPEPPAPEPETEEKLLRRACEEYQDDYDFERRNWEDARDDLRFAAGDQWTNEAQRLRKGRPTLTINKLGQYRRQVIGDIRLNSPQIKVRPVDGNADVGLADVLSGTIRNIEQASRAKYAYIKAADNAATCGMGAFRITTEYSDNDSFDLDIRIRRIANPFAVLWDRAATEPTREDAAHCFVVNRLTLAQYKANYPQAQVADFELTRRIDWLHDWWSEDDVRVAEYWTKVPATKRLALMEDGTVLDVTGLPAEALLQLPVSVSQVRDVNTHRVVQYVISGAEILEGPNEWPGRYIPIIPVWGDEINVGETVTRFGLVRFAKDAQRMFNYHRSAAVETIGLTPKQPFIMTPTQIEGHETQWANANTENPPYLLANRDGDLGLPQRQPPITPNIAAVQEAASATDDLHAVTGLYPPSLGQRSNETSGKAILARERQGDVGSFVYSDNLALAISYCGTQLVDLIPKVYDTNRVVRVLGEDGTHDWVELNKTVMTPQGEQLVNDLSVGEYDVVVETGPSFSTRRQEANESLMDFVKAVPQAGAVIGDLIAKTMDWPGADELRKRLRKLLPPGLADPEPGEEPPPPPEQQGPPPELLKVLAEIEMQKRQSEAEIANMVAKAEADIEIKRAKAEADLTNMIAKVEAQIEADCARMLAQHVVSNAS